MKRVRSIDSKKASNIQPDSSAPSSSGIEMAAVLKSSCVWCVKEKRKCGGGQPCNQCIKRERGTECAYEIRKKSGPKSRGGGTPLMAPVTSRPKRKAIVSTLVKKLEAPKSPEVIPELIPEPVPRAKSLAIVRQHALAMSKTATNSYQGFRTTFRPSPIKLQRSDTGSSSFTTSCTMSSQSSFCSQCERMRTNQHVDIHPCDHSECNTNGESVGAELARRYMTKMKYGQRPLFSDDDNDSDSELQQQKKLKVESSETGISDKDAETVDSPWEQEEHHNCNRTSEVEAENISTSEYDEEKFDAVQDSNPSPSPALNNVNHLDSSCHDRNI